MSELYLEHHGIKGQKWGVRRFQNADGTLTSAGKKRYGQGADSSTENKKTAKKITKVAKGAAVSAGLVAAAYVYANNKSAIDGAVKTAMVSMQMNTGALMAGAKASPTIAAGKAATKNAMKKFSGTAVGKGAKRVLAVSTEGASIVVTKQLLDKLISEGKHTTFIDAYNAYNKKNKVTANNVKKILFGEDDEDDEE